MDAIVFDWDGTLVDTLPAILEANAEVLREHGVSFDLGRYRETYAPDWRVMYLRLGIPEAAVERAGARWLELYSATATVGPFAGVVEALQRLAAAGFAMGLVTAGHRALVELQLERFGLAGLLPVRVCGDDDVAAKPHPAPLLRALAELGIGEPTGHSTYIGDAPDDMRMAAAVGARGVGITSILATADDLREAGADEVHASVPEWVAAFLSSSAPAANELSAGTRG